MKEKGKRMFNRGKLAEIISVYKENFSEHWKEEKYKWEAVQYFQKHWDIHAENFRNMFLKSTDKTYNLLASMNNYPRNMIKSLSAADPEAVRGMFLSLFDESKDLAERMEQFQASADDLRIKYDRGSWSQHYQTPNAITTYLWLRYPDKYYIYKYSEVKAFAKAIDSDFVPRRRRMGKPYSRRQGIRSICLPRQGSTWHRIPVWYRKILRQTTGSSSQMQGLNNG